MNCPKCNANLVQNACLRCGYNGEAREIYIQHNTGDGKPNNTRVAGLIIGILAGMAVFTCIIVLVVTLVR